jgi:hypothetical protein
LILKILSRYHLRMKPIALTFAILFLSGCGLYWNYFGPELQLYDGPKRQVQEVATIDQGIGCWTCVRLITSSDQKDSIYTLSPEAEASVTSQPNKISLLPGQYEVSILYRGPKNSRGQWTGKVDLRAGHTYRVLNDYSSGLFSGSGYPTAFVWMEDADTGDVVLGKKP